jgi:hypothetical protein
MLTAVVSIRNRHFGQRGRCIGSSSGSDLGMAASVGSDLKCLGRGALLCFGQFPSVKPQKPYRQLSQIVSGVTNRELACPAQRIRSMLPQR